MSKPKAAQFKDPKKASRWQLQTAKARFSELVRRALTEGPQTVTRQGRDEVVVIPADYFEQLRRRSTQPKSLVQFFAESPLAEVELDLSRDMDSGREIKL
jgi:prevent-host-death family protein